MTELTTTEAARELGVGQDWVRHLIKCGALRARRASNGRWLVEVATDDGLTPEQRRRERHIAAQARGDQKKREAARQRAEEARRREAERKRRAAYDAELTRRIDLDPAYRREYAAARERLEQLIAAAPKGDTCVEDGLTLYESPQFQVLLAQCDLMKRRFGLDKLPGIGRKLRWSASARRAMEEDLQRGVAEAERTIAIWSHPYAQARWEEWKRKPFAGGRG